MQTSGFKMSQMTAKEVTNYSTIIRMKGEENKLVISKSLEKFIDVSKYHHPLWGEWRN